MDTDDHEELSEVDVDEAERIYFREIQHMSRLWLLAVLVGVVVGAVSPGTFPVTDWEAGVLITVMLLTGIFLYSIRLTTEVREDGFYVRLFPLHQSFRRFGFDEIEEIETDTYSVLEYGGWGLRWSILGRGKAYTTKGRGGVRIDFEDGGSVFVGSQTPDGLIESVREARSDK